MEHALSCRPQACTAHPETLATLRAQGLLERFFKIGAPRPPRTVFTGEQRAAMMALGESCGWSMWNLSRAQKTTFCEKYGITSLVRSAPAAARPHCSLDATAPLWPGWRGLSARRCSVRRNVCAWCARRAVCTASPATTSPGRSGARTGRAFLYTASLHLTP